MSRQDSIKAIQGHAHRRWHMIHVDSPDSPRRSFHRIICIGSSHHGFCKTRWWNAQGKWNFVVKLYKSWKNSKSTTWWSYQPSSNHLQLDHFHVIIGFDVDFGWKGDRPLSCCKLAWEIAVKKSERQYFTVKVRWTEIHAKKQHNSAQWLDRRLNTSEPQEFSSKPLYRGPAVLQHSKLCGLNFSRRRSKYQRI